MYDIGCLDGYRNSREKRPQKIFEGWSLSQKRQNCQLFLHEKKPCLTKKQRIVFEASFLSDDTSWNIMLHLVAENLLAFLQAAHVGPENGQLTLSSLSLLTACKQTKDWRTC